MIVDKDGKPMRSPVARVKAVVFKSIDGESWEPVTGQKVPQWVRDHDVMADMIDGAIVALQDDGPYFKAQHLN